MIDKHIGKVGTERRDAFENELRIDLLGQAIKQARQERNLTQAQLGELVGVQKAQISKIENSIKNARFETILNVFNALGAKVNFSVELNNRKLG
jgi:transcriptional regulator with XRE-family HTH domain